MAEKILIQKNAYGISNYNKVIDTTFRQLVPPPQPPQQDPTVEDFFQLYEQLFLQIPPTGENNSHEYLIKTSGEYLGDTVISDNEKALLEEINDLRRELLELSRTNVNG